jgi:hypothetical protein
LTVVVVVVVVVVVIVPILFLRLYHQTLAGIIKSVTAPGFSLLMVFYLFVVTVTIYASFGQSWFQKYLVVPGYDEESGEESDGKECGSTLSCFYFLFYTQLAGPLGELREHMRVVDPKSVS